jgi:hypothetical protein
MCCDKSYDVEWAYDSVHGDILRPIKAIHSREFEEVFGFRSNCEGFTTDKVISIIVN